MIIGDLIYGSDVPERKMAQLGQSGEDVIKNEIELANQNPNVDFGQIDSDLKAGQDVYDKGLLGGSVGDAIKQKYGRLLGERLDDQRFNQKENVRFKQIDRMKRAQSALLAKQQIQNDIYSAVVETQMRREAARAEAISGLLGFAGSVAGYQAATYMKQKDGRDFNAMKNEMNQSPASSNGLNNAGWNRSMKYRNTIQAPQMEDF